MIVELITYTLKSRSQSLVEERVEQALPERTQLSRLGGCWRTEVGVLNQLIVAWPYASAAERDSVTAAAARLKTWPPAIDEFIVERQSRILTLAPFSPLLAPRVLGNLYEIRIYGYAPGQIAGVISAWTEILDERLKYSPLVGAWYSESGPMHEWIHVWAYHDAAERERVRVAAAAAGVWPISVVDRRLQREPRAVSLRMQNMLVIPTRFSPLR